MSWGIAAIGKPSEIAEKVKNALAPSRNGQPNHAGTFDAIEAVVREAAAPVADSSAWHTSGRTDRQILVESMGHIDSGNASVSLTIKTILEFTPAE